MSIDQPLTPDFATRKDELTYRLGGVEAAIQSATRMDDQEWLEWLKTRRDELQGQLAKEQGNDENSLDFAEHLPPVDWKQAKEQAE